MSLATLTLTSLLTTLALVLVFAAISKVRKPEPLRRALGVLGLPASRELVPGVAAVELAVAALALGAPAHLAGAASGGLFVCFALVAHLLGHGERGVGCGCLGEEAARPPGRAHVAACALAAAGAILAAVVAPPSLLHLLRGHPGRAFLVLVEACAALALWRLMAGRSRARRSASTSGFRQEGALGAAVPASIAADRVRSASVEGIEASLGGGLVGVSASLLEHRFSRRSALLRLALAGSAFCVAPLRYLLYPGSALAVIAPWSCASGECTDGYTAFCCQINKGLNQCPAGTYPGGWWKCTDYRGRQLCSAEGVRYYVDCNAIPGRPFPGGCRCANDTCADQRINCNIFRYGQCNPQVAGVTAVVCRMVTCQNPSSIPALKCSSSLSVDDAVCAQDAGCLEPAAVQLAGAGGV